MSISLFAVPEPSCRERLSRRRAQRRLTLRRLLAAANATARSCTSNDGRTGTNTGRDGCESEGSLESADARIAGLLPTLSRLNTLARAGKSAEQTAATERAVRILPGKVRVWS